LIIFLANILSWFALLRFATGAHWNVFNAMLILAMPLVLYVVSDLVVPPLDGERRTDLKEHYFQHCRWFAGLLAAFVVISAAVQFAVARLPDLSGGGVLRGISFLALLAGVSSRRPAVQATLTLVLLAIGLAGAALISSELM
jgi:hypothetical protein